MHQQNLTIHESKTDNWREKGTVLQKLDTVIHTFNNGYNNQMLGREIEDLNNTHERHEQNKTLLPTTE